MIILFLKDTYLKRSYELWADNVPHNNHKLTKTPVQYEKTPFEWLVKVVQRTLKTT